MKNGRRQTIANTSALQFEQEFGNTFHGRGNTLIDAIYSIGSEAVDPMDFKETYKVYTHNQKIGNEYVMSVDVAKGRGSGLFYL